MSALALGLLGGGTLLNGAGSFLGGNAQSRAVRRADDDQVGRFRGQQGMVGTGMLGAGYGRMPYFQTIYGQGLERGDQNLINEATQGFNDFTSSVGGSVLDQQRRLADSVSARQTGNLARFDTDTSMLAGRAGAANASLDNMWTNGSNNLMGLAAGAESMARNANAGRDRIIRRDAATQENAMNQRSRAALAASGFGNSTAVGNAMSENAASVGEQRDRALQDVHEATQRSVQDARGRRLNLGASLLAGRAGASERTGQSQVGRDYARASDRMALENANLTRDVGLRQDPINTVGSFLNGPINNPYSSYTTPVVPAGGSAAALSSVGGALAGGGSYLAGASNQQQLLQQLALMGRMGGAGGFGGYMTDLGAGYNP